MNGLYEAWSAIDAEKRDIEEFAPVNPATWRFIKATIQSVLIGSFAVFLVGEGGNPTIIGILALTAAMAAYGLDAAETRVLELLSQSARQEARARNQESQQTKD